MDLPFDPFKTIRQLWLAVIPPGVATLVLLIRHGDWDAAYSDTSFAVIFWITVGILVLIGVTGDVLLFSRGGPMVLLERLGILGALTILVSVATILAVVAAAVVLFAAALGKDSSRSRRR